MEQGEVIHAIPQLPAQRDDRWSTRALAVSPDGNLLASFPPETLSALQIWDISSITNLTGATETSAVMRRVTPVSVNRKAINAHLLTLPLAHATPPTPSRPASWLRGAATIGSTPPLFIVQDLGTLLTQPQAAVARPRFLPMDVDTSAYLDFLNRLSVQPLLRRVSSWDISDSMAGVVIARLIEGIKFSAEYSMSEHTDVVTFARALGAELDRAQPEDLWRQTDPAQRPGLNALLPAEAKAKIETNLRRLDPDELRFLNQYGPRFTGAPDPRELLDLFSLLDVPPAVQQSLTQMLRLIPRISQCRSGGGSQTYAMGGYAGITNKGSLDSLVPTELAYPSDVLLHRLLNQEALYYGRETERERSRELVYLVTQSGLELLGDGDVLAKALTLALAQTMHRRGYEVQQSFVGSAWTEPATMLRPADVHRVLYHRDRSSLRPKEMLEAVLAQLREWSERYRTLQVMWIVGEHWDADDCAAHRDLYNAVRSQAEQQAWFIRIGKDEASGRRRNPPAARSFGQHQVIGSELMWAGMDAPKRIFVAPESKPAVMPKPVAAIHFDGIYFASISEERINVLRFFQDGTLQSASFVGKVDLPRIHGWLRRESPFPPSLSGSYALKGSQIEFRVIARGRVAEGFGAVSENDLQVDVVEYEESEISSHSDNDEVVPRGVLSDRRPRTPISWRGNYRFLHVEQ
ncbi:MAG TPA: hypothetical protein VFX97_05530 [Pyrinomonadaceae bacterium]|nr:hypothetical protein [Pyrinomonadaceae bacterium]